MRAGVDHTARDGEPERVVVLLDWQLDGWPLPPFRPFASRVWIGGGERTMLELGAACAAAGFEVELRGDFMESEVAAHERVAGVVLHRPQEPRAARPSDILLIPEGHPEPLAFARAALGPARAILCVLAAPGLFGWSFDGSEPCEEPMRVDPRAVGRPEQLEAARHLGLELWTNTRAIADQARAHGTPHHYIGVGRPSPYPAAPAKSIDVVIVGDNRWAALSREAIAGLRGGVSTAQLPSLPRDELLPAIGAARILVHLVRIEGRSRLCEEAHAMRTVPVMLTSNHMGEGTDAASGGVAVEDIAAVAPTVHALLDDPTALHELATAGYEHARSAGDWEPFVARVKAALSQPDREVTRFADGRAAIGAALSAREHAMTVRLDELASEADARSHAVAVLSQALADARDQIAAAQLREQGLEARLAAAEVRYQRLRNRRVVRTGLHLASVLERARSLRGR